MTISNYIPDLLKPADTFCHNIIPCLSRFTPCMVPDNILCENVIVLVKSKFAP